VAVSLKDVAARAGVSFKTVSNVVNGQQVRPDTLERVQRAIDELGYRPNLSARSLRRGRTGVIALALPELTAPYFAELARAVIGAAEARGWTVLVDETDGNRARELEVLRGIRSHLIDGAILSPLALGRDEDTPPHPQVPLVLLGERLFPGPVDHVAFDNVAAADTAVTHLLERGRHRIAALGHQSSRTAETARLRLSGWRQALEAGGQAADGDLVLTADRWHREDGYAAVQEMLATTSRRARPDALFCCNDLLAIGALRALAEAGVRVPDDIAVIGIDDIEEGRFTSPSLTTIAPDKQSIAERSIELLALRLDEGRSATRAPEHPPQDVETSFTLVVREST
jgi:DNA-binding LacI/PurR family transcriptional regulator